jgi:hypothetical protein
VLVISPHKKEAFLLASIKIENKIGAELALGRFLKRRYL